MARSTQTRHQVLGGERGNRITIDSLHSAWNQKIQRVMTVFLSEGVMSHESNDNLQQREQRETRKKEDIHESLSESGGVDAKGMCLLSFMGCPVEVWATRVLIWV